MALKSYKPTTPSRRNMTSSDFRVLTKKRPLKKLLGKLNKRAGRDRHGKISVRHRGSGVKKIYRQIDFKQDKFEIPAKVVSIEYDPNRSSYIALLNYKDGEKRYILAPEKLKVGDTLLSSRRKIEWSPGNRIALKKMAVGTMVHNIELVPGQGGRLARAAGSYATVMAKEGKFVHLKMPSSEERLIPKESMASVGQLGNTERTHMKLGKAGRKRWMGIRPTVRGSAMNPVDHPHGGGEGRSPIGRKNPKTPWGKPTLGKKTRRSIKKSDRYILHRRNSKK